MFMIWAFGPYTYFADFVENHKRRSLFSEIVELKLQGATTPASTITHGDTTPPFKVEIRERESHAYN